MITAIDSNVLLDLLTPDAPHNSESFEALGAALDEGPLIISEPVYAEVSLSFEVIDDLERFLSGTAVRLAPSSPETLFRSGQAWRSYLRRRPAGLRCPRCGATTAVACNACGASFQTRQHLIADFLIGAHAAIQADQLLTRDRGYYVTYFPELKLA